MMTRTTKFLLIAAFIFAAFIALPSPSQAQPGYGQQQTVNCSSNDGRRNYCGQYGTRDIRLSRQISGSQCIQGQTWGVDRGGLWVDRGCRADFFVAGGGYGPPPGPPPPQIITCSSNDGRRNWCDTGGRTDIRLNHQISGSACVQGDTWGIDRRGLWVDRGCRAEFRIR